MRAVRTGQDLDLLRQMMLIREFEIVSLRLSGKAKIPGGMHSAAGQEAIAVGTVAALGDQDVLASTHRSHHHALAMGLEPSSVMAELYGKSTGCCGGRGGHMHLADFGVGLFGSNGIVGGGLGIAMGAAFASKTLKRRQISVGFVGDGGLNTGRVWEFLNLAAIWGLPLVAICENNQYAVETHIGRMMASASATDRARGFGLHAVCVDGQDLDSVAEAVGNARHRALAGEGPTFIEAVTYRFEGHNTGDPQPYRTREEVERWKSERDPIEIYAARLTARGALSSDLRHEMSESVIREVKDAVEFAETSPWPPAESACAGVYAQDLDGVEHRWS